MHVSDIFTRCTPSLSLLLLIVSFQDWEKWQFHYYEKLIYHSKVPVINDETPLQQRTNKTTSSEKCALYMVSRQGGVSVRETTDFSSPVVTRLPKDYRVVLSEIRNGRAHIVVPVDGWVSLQSRNGNHVLSKCKLPRMARPLGILQCGNLERNSRTYESPFRTSSTLAARTDPMKSSNRRQTLCWESELMKIAAQCVAKESRKSWLWKLGLNILNSIASLWPTREPSHGAMYPRMSCECHFIVAEKSTKMPW